MSINRNPALRASLVIALVLVLTAVSLKVTADCNPNPTPFTDLAGVPPGFCQAIAEAYFSALTFGTTATTFSPSDTVDRQQMAAFITRTLDQSLRRGGRRAALGQWWTTTPRYDINLATTAVGLEPSELQSDGTDIWVNDASGDTVSRVRASDGKLLETWTGATRAVGILIAMGRVFVTGQTAPGKLYMIDPTQTAGTVTTVASNLGNGPGGIAFDGLRLWIANSGSGGGISIVTPKATLPWDVESVTGLPEIRSILYDGQNVWAASFDSSLMKLDSNGTVITTITLGSTGLMVFDGTNLWVPNLSSGSVSVVRTSAATVLATLTGNGLNNPLAAAFDGERVLITNENGHSVSLWKAADLTPLGTFSTGAESRPFGACSDGVNFWIALVDSGKIARF